MVQETKSAAMPTDLKYRNRIKILEVFKSMEKKSVNEISEITGISRQTVVKSINFFIEKGILSLLGKGNSTEIGGKRPEIYALNREYTYFLFIIISESKLTIGIMDLSGKVLSKKTQNIRKDCDIYEISSISGESLRSILCKVNISPNKIYSTGICMGGIYDRERKVTVYNSIFPSWGEDIPMYEIFEKELPKDCKIIIENEAKAAGRAEIAKTKELSEKRILTIYTADGISAALIENGKIVYGKNSLIGEIGHMFLGKREECSCDCGLSGCFEQLVSDNKLLEIYGDKNSNITDIFCQAEKNDGKSATNARRAVLYAAEYFAEAIRNIILLTDPDVIIIQGKFARAGSYFGQIIEDKIREFKYFGRSRAFELIFDADDTEALKLSGITEILTDNFFLDENIYN